MIKICYIAPVKALSESVMEITASQFLTQLTNIIYIGGFGICGVVAFLRILRTYLKCKQINNFYEMKVVVRDCALGIGGMIALPHLVKFIDYIFDVILLQF